MSQFFGRHLDWTVAECLPSSLAIPYSLSSILFLDSHFTSLQFATDVHCVNTTTRLFYVFTHSLLLGNSVFVIYELFCNSLQSKKTAVRIKNPKIVIQIFSNYGESWSLTEDEQSQRYLMGRKKVL